MNENAKITVILDLDNFRWIAFTPNGEWIEYYPLGTGRAEVERQARRDYISSL